MIKAIPFLRSLKQYLESGTKAIPFVHPLNRYLQKSAYEQRFSGECYGCFRGVFETFDEAILSAPKTKKIGYNEPDLAQEYQRCLKQQTITTYDYPVIFWLKDILKENYTVFDFGGNVGIHYYIYQKYLSYPPNLKWVVCEVPEIIKAGEQLAKENKQHNLLFTNEFETANNAEIFIASGSIQYVECLFQSLLKLNNKPKHILINRLPLYDGKQFVTLQNGGMVFYPQYVFNKKDFIDSLCSIGYKLIDIWKDRDDNCKIPFYPENSVSFYSGLYFKLMI